MAASEDQTFGALLRQQRRAAGFSQEALAERAGLSVAAIAAIERGRRTRPHPDTVALLAAALALAPADRDAFMAAGAGASQPAPERAIPHLPATLPIPPTLMIGRERTEAAAAHFLQRANGPRLLTLTGPGGVGKTRLALAVAALLREEYADGVSFIDLSALRDHALVATTLAHALGLRAQDGQPVDDLLVAHLRDQHRLLVLDNFEQVRDAAPLVADLLARCPHLTLLVTSRTVLRVRGEQQFRVPPLAVPPSGRPVAPETVAGYPAVQLFVARAQAIRPDFALNAANAAVVAQICERLDGLPLAIELAAARVTLLPPADLLARLERRLTVLRDGARDLPTRQRTMRATIGWSYDLLDADEQALFARLGVFAGSGTLAAIAAICATGDDMETLDIVTALADMSMLLPMEGGGEPRVAMLATLREYARDRLEERGEAARLDRVHAAYYLALAEAAEPMLTGAEQGAWLDRLEREYDNLRVALARALEWKDAATTLRLTGALWPFWEARGHLDEGRRWLTRALAIEGEVAPLLRGKALRGAGLLATWQGDFAAARSLHEESLALYRALDDRLGIANALENLGLVAREQGDYAAAAALHAESLTIRRALGDRRGIAGCLNNLGLVARDQGDYLAARALFAEGLAIHRDLSDPQGIANALSNLGMVAYWLRDYATAQALHAESLAIRRALGDPRGVAISLINLAMIAYWQGDYTAAQALHRESLTIKRALGGGGIAESLEGLAAVAGARGEGTRAARLLGAAATLRETLSRPQPPDERADQERWVARIRIAGETEEWHAAWDMGRSMPMEQVIAEALEGAATARVPR
ncbi:MAG: tetratricopeptide repeat protein [Chloroflexota bacterium]|nr:tetratricopeptide repeat protein [Chloroflexota bacterium]